MHWNGYSPWDMLVSQLPLAGRGHKADPWQSSCHGLTTEHCSSGQFPVPDIKRRPCLSFCLLSTHQKRLPTRLDAGPLSSHWPSWKKAVLLPNRDAAVLPSVTFGVSRVHLGSLLKEWNNGSREREYKQLWSLSNGTDYRKGSAS